MGLPPSSKLENGLQKFLDGLQSKQIGVLSKAADLSDAHRRDHRFVAERLAGMDVGHVHLDAGLVHRGDGVADRVAVVGVGTRVDDDAVKEVERLVNFIDQTPSWLL